MRLGLLITFLIIGSMSFSQSVETRKNSIYAEALGYSIFFGSINYERTIRLGELANLGLRGGVAFSYGVHGIVELNGFFFGPKHSVEVGIGTCSLSGWHFSDDPNDNYFKFSAMQPSGRVGYRYQGEKGLLIKGAPYFFHDGEQIRIWPSASIGYSF